MKKLLLSLLLVGGIQILESAGPKKIAPPVAPKAVLQKCPICLDSKDRLQMWTLPKKDNGDCGHEFCRRCITGWAEQKLECPMCRTVFAEGDVPPIPEEKVDLDALIDEWNLYEGILNLEDRILDSVQGFNDFTRAPEITDLYIGRNPIRTLPAGAFEKYANLEQLHLDRTKLLVIDQNAFRGLSKLKILSLAGLKLGRENSPVIITPQMVAPLESLEKLNLDENNLKTLPEWVQSLTNLKQLNLDKNQLELTDDTFRPFAKLKVLGLASNQLEHLPENIFKNMPLTTIYLEENQFRVLPSALNVLNNLTELHLSENLLELTKDSFIHFPELEILDLSYNSLNSIPENMLNDLFLLKELNLSDNNLQSLPVGLFENLSQLIYLDLVGNNFSPEEQARIKEEVISSDCKIYFTPKERIIGNLELKLIEGSIADGTDVWESRHGGRYTVDEDGEYALIDDPALL